MPRPLCERCGLRPVGSINWSLAHYCYPCRDELYLIRRRRDNAKLQDRRRAARLELKKQKEAAERERIEQIEARRPQKPLHPLEVLRARVRELRGEK